MVSMFSAAEESIRERCHDVAKMAMNEAAQSHRFSPAEIEPHVGTRLDVFLAGALGHSRSRVQAMLKAGGVQLEPSTARAEASYRLRVGDAVNLVDVPPAPSDSGEDAPRGEAIALDILYEDAALLALNKQPGLVVHPAVGHRTGTLVNALVHYLGPRLAGRGGSERLGLVHRLDQDTSGVIIIAKTNEAHEKVAAAFAAREVRKFYRALCWGVFRRATGSMREPIGRNPVHRQKMAVVKRDGREAHTDYRIVAQGLPGADVECRLHTGRTHQIRVHLAHHGHPVWGDKTYGRPHVLADGYAPERQMLHAARLEVAHPLTGKALILEAPLPADYTESRRRLLG